MFFPADILERYVKTSVDFLFHRPRVFLQRRSKNPARYLSPYAYLGWSIAVFIALTFIGTTLRQNSFDGLPVEDAKALAGQRGVRVLLMVVFGSCFWSIACRFWPVRHPLKFVESLHFMCFLSVIYVIMGIITAVQTETTVLDFMPTFLLRLIGTAIGLIGAAIYTIPGIACICKVPVWKVWVANIIWALPVIGFVNLFFPWMKNIYGP
jgi:hypothetical protein